jgi:F420-dependent oxidoreductase-like protein
MRFAIKTAPQHTTWADVLAVWREADDIDLFESAWTFDHFYPIFSDSTGPCLEGWLTTTALAQATRRLRVGVLVTGNVYRHPAVLANMAATLDHISGGRLELGIGAGWNEEECAAYGIDLPPLKERFDRFDEATEILVRLLTQTETDFDGRYYRLTAARCEPKPIQQPHPPVVIGGSGERRTLRTVARWADHWNSIVPTPERWSELRAVLDDHCAAEGRDPTEIESSVNLRFDREAGPGALAEAATGFGEAGVDVVVVGMPAPYDPADVGTVAGAVADLAT